MRVIVMLALALTAAPANSYEPRQPHRGSDVDASLLPAPCRGALPPQQWHRRHDVRGDLVQPLHQDVGGVRDLLGCPAVRPWRQGLPLTVGLRSGRAPYVYGFLRSPPGRAVQRD